MAQLVHYGKILAIKMAENKASKQFVMKILNYQSYDTLRMRIEDARFSYDELRVLKEKGLL